MLKLLVPVLFVAAISGASDDAFAQQPQEQQQVVAAVAPSTQEIAMEVHGRVLFLVANEHTKVADPFSASEVARRRLVLSLPAARASLEVRPLDWARVVIEADFGGGRPSLKDGFAQAGRKRWRVRAGQFKMPISAFTMESPWTLPLARRGWLEDILSDQMLLTGRRRGIGARVQGGGYWDPALSLTVVESVNWGAQSGDALNDVHPVGLGDQTVLGRLSVTPGGVELAAVAQLRVTGVPVEQQFTLRRFWAAGADLTADWKLERTGIRVWADGLIGSSWLHNAAVDGSSVSFVAARALAAWRWGGLARGERYIELFATVGVLEPDTSVTGDLFWEAMGGINLGDWRRARLTLQVEKATTLKNFPQKVFGFRGNLPLIDHLAFVMLTGIAF